MQVTADRILIVLLGAIGDVTRALPLLNRIRQGYPGARITWAVEPLSAPLLQDHPALDAVLVFDRPRGLPAFLDFIRAVRAVRPTVTLDLQRHLKSGVVSRVSGAPVRLGFPRDNSREGNWLFNTHAVDAMPHFSSKLQQFLCFADWLEIPPAPVEFGLRLSGTEERRVEELLTGVRRPFVAAFVGSSCESRLWFPDRTAAVVTALGKQGIETVLVGGPGDVGFATAAADIAGSSVRNLAGRTTLRDLIGIFGRAAATFGPDSGPMHIAAAVGAPVVSLWGATSPARSAPWRSEAEVLVGEAPCMPCYLKRCPIGRLCMQHIGADSVLSRLLPFIESAQRTRRE